MKVKKLMEILKGMNPNSKIVVKYIDEEGKYRPITFNHFHIYEKGCTVIIHKLDDIPTRSKRKAIKLKEETERMKEAERIMEESCNGHMAVLREKLRRKKAIIQ